MGFSERLSELQAERGLERRDVYSATGISQPSYHRYVTGERTPTMPVLVSLANFFNVSIDYLVGRSNNPARLP